MFTEETVACLREDLLRFTTRCFRTAHALGAPLRAVGLWDRNLGRSAGPVTLWLLRLHDPLQERDYDHNAIEKISLTVVGMWRWIKEPSQDRVEVMRWPSQESFLERASALDTLVETVPRSDRWEAARMAGLYWRSMMGFLQEAESGSTHNVGDAVQLYFSHHRRCWFTKRLGVPYAPGYDIRAQPGGRERRDER